MSDIISSVLEQLYRSNQLLSHTVTVCLCLLTWYHQPVDASLSAFPADWSGIGPHAVHYPGDPLSQSHLGRPYRWHTTLGYHQTEKFKTHTDERLHQGYHHTTEEISCLGKSVYWGQSQETIWCIKYKTDLQCHRVSILLFMLNWQIIAPTQSTQLFSVCEWKRSKLQQTGWKYISHERELLNLSNYPNYSPFTGNTCKKKSWLRQNVFPPIMWKTDVHTLGNI